MDPSPSVVNGTPVDYVNDVSEREIADDRDTGDESGDDSCVFLKVVCDSTACTVLYSYAGSL